MCRDRKGRNPLARSPQALGVGRSFPFFARTSAAKKLTISVSSLIAEGRERVEIVTW